MFKTFLKCKICKSNKNNNFTIVKNLPGSAQLFTKKKTKKNDPINLKIFKCSFCGVLQIKNKPVSYYKNVIRTTGQSEYLKKIRKKQIQWAINKLNNKGNYIEIGCGSGENIKIFSKYTNNIYGTENSKKNFLICKKNKLKVFNLFLSDHNHQNIKKKFNCFFIFNFLEHIPNINNFIKNLKKILTQDVIGIIEVPNFDMIKKKKLYTEIILDHLYYFEKKTLINALQINGLEVIKTRKIFDDYILSVTVKNNDKIIKKKPLKNNFNIQLINKNLIKAKRKIKIFFKKFNNKSFIIWGAGHQSLTFISHFKIQKYIKYIVDSADFKQNKYAPGSNLKIINPIELKNEKKIFNILILVGGYNSEVVKIIKQKYKKFKTYYIANNNKVIAITRNKN
jgi:2-polyprenyl-3-methyl-5-hydroxy-6-metoxy-1,4-benzoquinol methylase